MAQCVDPKLRNSVERYVHQRFPEDVLDGILIEQGLDSDGDEIVKVVVLVKAKPDSDRVSGLARRLWEELSKQNFGFPILSFQTADEHARLSATA